MSGAEVSTEGVTVFMVEEVGRYELMGYGLVREGWSTVVGAKELQVQVHNLIYRSQAYLICG